MKTFVLMSRLCSKGPSPVGVATAMRDTPKLRQWIDRARRLCPEANFIAHYALLGSYDYMDIYEAPDEETAAKMSMICSADGNFQVESWTAIPDEKLTRILDTLESDRTESGAQA